MLMFMLIKNLYNIKISLMLGEGCKTGTCAYLPPIYDVITQEKQTGIQRLYKWEHLKNAYELINLAALKFSPANKIRIFQCMGKIFCVEFQSVPLKFHTRYLTHIMKDEFLYNVEILRAGRFMSS